ncbi:MAG UNVERIFIED_CONTAM: hypothetical protein LVR29_14110 [Microcystis novacekii LVE1205-3]
MNLAVHGLKEISQKAMHLLRQFTGISWENQLCNGRSYLNVDEVDSKVDGDERLPLGIARSQ